MNEESAISIPEEEGSLIEAISSITALQKDITTIFEDIKGLTSKVETLESISDIIEEQSRRLNDADWKSKVSDEITQIKEEYRYK